MRITETHCYKVLQELVELYNSAEEVFKEDRLIKDFIEISSLFMNKLYAYRSGEVDKYNLAQYMKELAIAASRVVRISGDLFDTEMQHEDSEGKSDSSIYLNITELAKAFTSDSIHRSVLIRVHASVLFVDIDWLIKDYGISVWFED